MPKNNHITVYARNAVADLKQYMDKNPVTHKTCRDLWQTIATTSQGTLEAAFREVTGYGVKEYLVLQRLEHSKQLLKQGWPVKRVAVKTLYKSQSAYCTAFKRHFNQSPTGWLKKAKIKRPGSQNVK
jgi:AraC-like DNA-binding protein